MGQANHADLWAALRDPAVAHGMCEDYRACASTARTKKLTVQPARRIACPTLLLTATKDDIDIHGDPEAILAPLG